MSTNFFLKDSGSNRKPTTDELIERGFAPQNGKIDVILIHPPTSVAERYGREDMGDVGGNQIPLGIASLAAFLREKKIGVGVIDCAALGIDSDKTYEIIKKKDPAIIGFSSTTYVLSKTIKLVEKIRHTSPNKLIVLGGSHANVAGMETVEQYDAFDIVSYGLDGEYIIYNIFKKYASKNFDRQSFMNDFEMLESIKGIIFKKNNTTVRNQAEEQLKNLDELPFPARDLFPLEKYIPLPNNYKRLPATNIIVIRGCPYWCTFCDQAGTGARRMSPERVIEELKHCVKEYGVKEVTFWDDTLCYHKKWMKEFLYKLIDSKLNLTWTCCAAVNTVDKETLKLMHKAGCWNIFYGYETAVDELAKNVLSNRKNRNFERMKQIAQWTKEAGIEVRGSFLIGLPGETPELAKQTVQNAIDLDPDYAQFTIVCPYPGTQIYKEIKKGKWGKFLSENFEDYHLFNVTWLPDGYKGADELKKMERYAYRKFYLRFGYILKKIMQVRRLEDIKRYIKGGRALIKGFI